MPIQPPSFRVIIGTWYKIQKSQNVPKQPRVTRMMLSWDKKNSNILQSLLTREANWIKAVIVPLQASISKCNTRMKCRLKSTHFEKKLPVYHLHWRIHFNDLFAQHQKGGEEGRRQGTHDQQSASRRKPFKTYPPITQWCQAATETASTLRVPSNKHQLQNWTLDHVSHMSCVLSCSLLFPSVLKQSELNLRPQGSLQSIYTPGKGKV